MKTSELKNLIRQTICEILAEETESEKLLNMKIKNPETGNEIELGSALGYDKKSPVYKAAKTAHDKAVKILKKDSEKHVQSTPAQEPAPESDSNKFSAEKLANETEQVAKYSEEDYENYENEFGEADDMDEYIGREEALLFGYIDNDEGSRDATDEDKANAVSTISSQLSSDNLAKRDAGISAIGRLGNYPDKGKEHVKSILQKSGTSPKEFYSSLKKLEAETKKQSMDFNLPDHVRSMQYDRQDFIRNAREGMEAMFGSKNESHLKLKDLIVKESTWKKPKSYFVAPKNAKYKDEKEVEKKFKRIPRQLKNFFTPTSTGIEINKKKFHEDAEELDENIDDGTEYYLEDYVVILDKKGGKNLMRVEEFRVDDYPEFALNAGLD